MDQEGSYRWVIENVATGDFLGTHTRDAGEATAEFGGRIPLLCADVRGANDIWKRHCRGVGYTERAISLKGTEGKDQPGPNYGAMPRVVYRQVMIVKTDFAHDGGRYVEAP
jgi:hypothetical protein